MTNILSAVSGAFGEPPWQNSGTDGADLLLELLDEQSYVGEVFSIGYNDALVQIHDFHRKQVGGLPALSFLIATRIVPGQPFDVREEDSSVILLRVLDH